MWKPAIDKNDTISLHVKISMISLISSLSLKLYLNSLVYHRNISWSSSKDFSNLWTFSDIFGNFRKFSENVRKCLSGLRNSFEKSSEIFGKWLEIFGKSSKTLSSVCLYDKKTLHVSSKIWTLCSRGKNNIPLVRWAHSWDIVLATRT